jgi:hypothetical protein
MFGYLRHNNPYPIELSSFLLTGLTRLNSLSKSVLPFVSNIKALRPKSLISITFKDCLQYHGMRPPRQPGVQEIREYLSHLFCGNALVFHHLYQQHPMLQTAMPSLCRRSLTRSLDEVNCLDPTEYALDRC